MKNILMLMLTFCWVNAYCDNAAVVNEYFTRKECKEIIDLIIENAGGEANIKKANSATYEAYINLNLIGLKISYKQVVKRYQELYKMEKDILGDKIITGFDGFELYQSAYGKLFKIPEIKEAEIAYTFQSSIPHQFVLKLKQKDFALKYLGIQEFNNKKVHAFQHVSPTGDEKHFFEVVSLQPIYSTNISNGLQWEVLRDSFKKQDALYYPVSVKMKLNQEELFNMTVLSMNFDAIDAKEFTKPNQEKLNIVLQPFAGQIRLQEIYKALQLFRDFDPINRSYPLPEKVKGMMGVHPQIGQPTLKIGTKNMFTYEIFRGALAEKLELESYPYILKGNVHKFTPLAWDKKDNYKTGRNVLFADGSISFLTENQFDSYLQTSLKRYPIIDVELEKEEVKTEK